VDTSLCTSYLPRRLPSGRATITVPSVTSPTSAATAAAAFAKDSVAWVQPERGVIAGHGEALRRVIKSPFSGFFVAMLQLADMAMALLVLWFLFGDEEWTLLVVSFAALVGSAVVFLIVEAIRLYSLSQLTHTVILHNCHPLDTWCARHAHSSAETRWSSHSATQESQG